MLKNKNAIAYRALAVLGALASCAGTAFGIPIFLSGSASITHTGNLGGTNDVRSLAIPSIPLFSSTRYQYSATGANAITNGTGTTAPTSQARAGIGYVIGANYLGLAIPAGVNLTQRNNTNTADSAASVLQIDFTARFLIQDTPFLNTQAGASFGITGNIPTGGSAFTELMVNTSFTYIPANGGTPEFLRGPINPNPFFRRTTPGSFVFSMTDYRDTLPRTLQVNDQVEITGFIRFRVHNDEGEGTLETTEDSGFIPSPGAAMLLALSGLVASRRKR